MASLLATPLSTRHSTPVATASGLLALLSEPDPTLVSHALTKLLGVVDTLWHEVAECLPDLEAIAEGGGKHGGDDIINDDDDDAAMATMDTSVEYDLSTRQTAAALASRVFFHLEEPVQALRLALESGEEHFDIINDGGSMYVERLVNAAVETYVKRKCGEFEGSHTPSTATATATDGEEDEAMLLDMDKLSRVVHLMFERCYADGTHGHALGVAFEAREADKVQQILSRLLADSGNNHMQVLDTLKYALEAASTLIPSKAFRSQALELISASLETVFGKEDASLAAKRSAACTLVLCRQLLGDAEAVAKIIVQLMEGGGEDGALLGLQLCFDIVDSGDQAFVTKVANGIPNETAEGEGAAEEEEQSSSSSSSSTATNTYYTQAHRILTGGFTSELSLSFLYKNSNSDKLIMTHLKKSLEERGMGRNSILHNCAVSTHAYLNVGTTNDSFLRDHLDWMKKASNW